MRALLVIYLTQHFLFSQGHAQALYGAYAALVYLIPVIGGVIADRYLGARKAVTIGAALLVLGHFGMAFEGSGSRQYLESAGQSYLVTAEGRGADRLAHIDLPEGRAQLRFDVLDRVELSAGGQTRTLTNGDYALISEAPSFVYSLCSMVGLPCGEAPATSLRIENEGDFPVRVDGAQTSVNIGGTSYALTQISKRDAVAFEGERVIRTFEDGSYSDRVEQEQLYVNPLSLAGAHHHRRRLPEKLTSRPRSARSTPGRPRDGNFTIFMGINLGAFLAPACGYLRQTYGWKWLQPGRRRHGAGPRQYVRPEIPARQSRSAAADRQATEGSSGCWVCRSDQPGCWCSGRTDGHALPMWCRAVPAGAPATPFRLQGPSAPRWSRR